MAKERVQKILAKAGIASRRKAEELITLGEVTINGKTAKLGDQAEWGVDAVKVGGKLLTATEAPVYLAFYKPKNVICAMTDPQGRPSLDGYFTRVQARVFPIGRLDFTSEGLVLLTNDGPLTEKIAKSRDLIRVYSVKVKGGVDPEMLKRIQRGMKGETGEIRPEMARIEEKLDHKTKIQVVLRGAHSADLRHLFETRGFLVDKMIRTSIGQITLHGMRPGEYRRLEASQFKALIEQPELMMKALEKQAQEDAEAAARRDDRAERIESKRVSSRIQPKVGKTVFESKPWFGDRPPLGDRKPSFGDRKPSFGDRKPSFGDRKPSFGDRKPSFGDRKPSFGDRKPSFGDRKPSFGDRKPSFGDRKPSFGDRKPSFGDRKPSFGDRKPSFGDRKPSFGDRKPSFGDRKPSFGDRKPSFGDRKPSFGARKPRVSRKPRDR